MTFRVQPSGLEILNADYSNTALIRVFLPFLDAGGLTTDDADSSDDSDDIGSKADDSDSILFAVDARSFLSFVASIERPFQLLLQPEHVHLRSKRRTADLLRHTDVSGSLNTGCLIESSKIDETHIVWVESYDLRVDAEFIKNLKPKPDRVTFCLKRNNLYLRASTPTGKYRLKYETKNKKRKEDPSCEMHFNPEYIRYLAFIDATTVQVGFNCSVCVIRLGPNVQLGFGALH